jgi:hypothetical protein
MALLGFASTVETPLTTVYGIPILYPFRVQIKYGWTWENWRRLLVSCFQWQED